MGVTMKMTLRSSRELSDAMKDLAKLTKKTAAETLKKQGRLLCVDFSMNSLPYGKHKAFAKTLEAKIERRIREHYWTIPEAKNAIKAINPNAAREFYRHIKGGHYSLAAHVMRKVMGGGNWKCGGFDGGSAHRSQRNQRKVTDKWVVTNKPALTAYIRKVKKRVGLTKSGYAAAAASLGGHRGIAGYATRQPFKPGYAKITSGKFSTRLTIVNSARGARQAMSPAREHKALAFRRKQITKTIRDTIDRKAQQRMRRMQKTT